MKMHTIVAASDMAAGVPAFLAKLWRLVEDEQTNHLIYWSRVSLIKCLELCHIYTALRSVIIDLTKGFRNFLLKKFLLRSTTIFFFHSISRDHFKYLLLVLPIYR